MILEKAESLSPRHVMPLRRPSVDADARREVTLQDLAAYFLSGGVFERAFGYYTMTRNTVATDIVTQAVPVKAAGVTTVQPDTVNFSHANNRLTYTGTLTRSFKVSVSASVTGGSNAHVGLYVAKNGALVMNSESRTTVSTNNHSEHVCSQTVVSLDPFDFIEAWVENGDDSSNVTVTNLSVIVEAIF